MMSEIQNIIVSVNLNGAPTFPWFIVASSSSKPSIQERSNRHMAVSKAALLLAFTSSLVGGLGGFASLATRGALMSVTLFLSFFDLYFSAIRTTSGGLPR